MNLQKMKIQLNCLAAEKCAMRNVLLVHMRGKNHLQTYCVPILLTIRYFDDYFKINLRFVSNALFFNVSVTNILNAENSRIQNRNKMGFRKRKKSLEENNTFSASCKANRNAQKSIHLCMDVAHHFLKIQILPFKCNDSVKFRAEQMYLSQMHSFSCLYNSQLLDKDQTIARFQIQAIPNGVFNSCVNNKSIKCFFCQKS